MKLLNTKWDGSAASKEVQYQLKIEGEALSFTVVFPEGVKGHPQAVAGEFTPELWKWDVGELFIASPNGRYLEINLAPNGAWWGQGFIAVREADVNFCHEDFGVRIDGERLICSVKALESYLGGAEDWIANVTAILDSPQYDFLSLALMPGEEADFHQPQSFLPFQEILSAAE